jgi:hypothetical protein
MKEDIKEGQFWLCRNRGTGNGDLVCGQVTQAPNAEDYPRPR